MPLRLKKFFKVLGWIFLALLLLEGWHFWGTKKKVDRGDLVVAGGKVYTREEFRSFFPPQYYNAPAKNTPEEVYAIFRQALLDGDIELALQQINLMKREEYRELFDPNSEKFNNWVKELPENIVNGDVSGNLADYTLDRKDGQYYPIHFDKDEKGYWWIDTI